MTTTFPNGQSLSSTALNVRGMNTIMQALATAGLGIGTDAPNYNSAVRTVWTTGGQPSYLITDDICYVRSIPVPDPYNLIRDKQQTYNDGVTVTETWTYTRVWKTSFSVVGPNSLDNARLLKSAFFLDFTLDALAQSNLFILPDVQEPTRIPELRQGQWWERVELEMSFNEAVTEVIQTPSILTAEIIINDQFGNTAIVNNVPPGFGKKNYGGGNFGF